MLVALLLLKSTRVLSGVYHHPLEVVPRGWKRLLARAAEHLVALPHRRRLEKDHRTHWHVNFNPENCTDWEELFPDFDDLRSSREGCEEACEHLERDVRMVSFIKPHTAICTCSAHPERPYPPGDNEKNPTDGPACVIAGLREPATDPAKPSLPECPCHVNRNNWMIVAVILWLLWLVVSVIILGEAISLIILLGVCCCAHSDPSEASDIHYMRCCCKTGGAFCCIAQGKLAPLHISKKKLVLLVLLDCLIFSSGGPGGCGIALIGFAANLDAPATRRGYYIVGIAYIIAYIIVITGLSFVITSPLVVPVWIYMKFCYLHTVISLVRLPCKERYAERYLSNALVVPAVLQQQREPEFAPADQFSAHHFPTATVISHGHQLEPQHLSPTVVVHATPVQVGPQSAVAQATVVGGGGGGGVTYVAAQQQAAVSQQQQRQLLQTSMHAPRSEKDTAISGGGGGGGDSGAF